MKESINWYWTPDLRIVRHVAQLNGISQVDECSDVAYLEAEKERLEEKREEWASGASKATNAIRSVYFEELLKEVDYQLEYVEQRLSELREPELLEDKNCDRQISSSNSVPTKIPKGISFGTEPEEPILNAVVVLTDSEERDRLFLERKVERAFYEAGKALKEIRDRRLYRSTHQTFEEYCADRFAFTRRRPYQLIDASIIVDNLLSEPKQMCTNSTQNGTDEMCTNSTQNEDKDETQMCTNSTQNETDEMCTNSAQILPTSEWQVRPLTNLEPDQQREAWQKAVEKAGGKVPSGRIVKSIVDLLRERRPIPNPWRVGEVATILVKENPDLRGKGGCWCVITEVHDFSCIVRLWDGNYQVKPENLKDLSYSNEQQEAVRRLSDRLTRISVPEVEKPMKDFLKGLGKLDRPYLTELEEKVLRMLEPSL